MNHQISYEDAKEAVNSATIYIASSVGPCGTKRLTKIGGVFRVSVNRKVFEFFSLKDAVKKYNNSLTTENKNNAA